jgi:adhesin transport system outer membrane protein
MAMGLSGCMSGGLPELTSPFAGLSEKPRAGSEAEVMRAAPVGAFAEAQAERGEEHRSSRIDALIARRSILPDGSPYDQVADAVLAASARGAEAELLRARMRAKAADKNWLPRLGPNVSLSSMGSFVASLVLDQVLFDNGLRAAERDFARADVEVAAVTLAQEQNDRVHSGLTLYLAAQESGEKAAASARAVERMRGLDRVMAARVAGGVSDRSEHNVIRAKLAELEAAHDAEKNRRATAMAELKAMSAGPVENVSGLSTLALPSDGASQALSLMFAGAEMERDVAAATMDRAGLIPGIAASAQIGNGGGAGVRLTSDQGIGFGMFDNMAASDASAEAARRKVSQAQEDANRKLAALSRDHEAQRARAAQAEGLAVQGRANAELFERQLKAGTRSVLEVAGLVESQARLEESAIAARYEIARSEIEIARVLGLLADGDRL